MNLRDAIAARKAARRERAEAIKRRMLDERRAQQSRAGKISASIRWGGTDSQRKRDVGRAAGELERVLNDRYATPEQLRAAGAALDG